MDETQKQIQEIQKQISIITEELEAVKKSLSSLGGSEDSNSSNLESNTIEGKKNKGEVLENGRVIIGFFDGENMVGPNEKKYSVPANYASKSKLVEGDKLKLTIGQDGSFIYKQIEPVERKKIIGTLKFENNAYYVLAEGHRYNVLYASVTYYKAKSGDKVTIIVPKNGNSSWAAIENVIHDIDVESSNDSNKEESQEPLDLSKEEAQKLLEDQGQVSLTEKDSIKNSTDNDNKPEDSIESKGEDSEAPSPFDDIEIKGPKTEGEFTLPREALGDNTQARQGRPMPQERKGDINYNPQAEPKELEI